MKNAARLLIPVVISLGLHSGETTATISSLQPGPAQVSQCQLGAVDHAATTPELTPTNTINGGTDQQQDLVDWALEQYAAAGLELPVLQFHLHSDLAACQGNQGLFSSGSIPWKITLCTEERMVFLHEIGHSWSEFNLTEAERTEYVEQRGMESWNDPETPWRERGSEDVANTLAWGLVDDPIRGMIPDGPLAQKNEAFRVLTGIDTPRISG